MNKTPELYWVIGTGTDVGKTTISKALIQVLNERNTAAVGLKPFAAYKLRDSLDFIFNQYPKSKCALFGGDAMKMCLASPLTGRELFDVVGPGQRMCWGTWEESILLRTGSTILGNVEYYKTQLTERLLSRPDFKRIIEIAGLSQAIANASLDLGEQTRMEKIHAAFEYLVTLKPEVVVCEGASLLLPTWNGSPKPNKIFLLNYEAAHVYENIDIDQHEISPGQGILTLKDILPALEKIKPKRSLMFFMGEESIRDQVAKDLARGLLDT